MATLIGYEGKVKIGANTVAEVTNWEVEDTSGVVDTTSLDNSDKAKTFKPGMTEWSGSLEAHYDPSDADGLETLKAGSVVTLNLFPEGDTTGLKYHTGSAIVQGRVRNMGGLEETQKISFSFKGSGLLSESTVA